MRGRRYDRVSESIRRSGCAACMTVLQYRALLHFHCREKGGKRETPHQILLDIHKIAAGKLRNECNDKHREPEWICEYTSTEEEIKLHPKPDEHPDNP